jgi:hypothetical protein
VAHTPNAQHVVIDQCQWVRKLLKDLESIGQLEPKLPRVAAHCHVDDTLTNLDKAACCYHERRINSLNGLQALVTCRESS